MNAVAGIPFRSGSGDVHVVTKDTRGESAGFLHLEVD